MNVGKVFPALVAGLLVALAPASAAAQSPGEVSPGILALSPYWGYNAVPYVRVRTPVADIIEAQGQFLIDRQRALLVREKVQQERLETRKKGWEYWAWERKFILQTVREMREEAQRDEERRLTDDPNPAEVTDATALNKLCKMLNKANGSVGQSVPLQAEWLPFINVTGSGGEYNVGLLKKDRLTCPMLFRRETFADDWAGIERLHQELRRKIDAGKDCHDELVELRKGIEQLHVRLNDARRAGAPLNQTTPARRALDPLLHVLLALENSQDAAFYLQPLRARTVAELVAYMNDKGLAFAAATAGDNRYYFILHEAMRREVVRRGLVPGR